MTDITKSRWPLLSPLLDELLDLEPPERAARLQAIRAGDERLGEELQELLSRHEAMDKANFLASPTRPLILAGQTVGAYTLEREIGQGGMGTVWLARRTDGRFEGQVAIKFLTAGLLGQTDNGRFAREGQILARLAHPNIARLVDAGVTAAGGQPYLVLEYVDGLPITRFCEQQGLDVTGRVQLFLAVLAAVEHAHNRLILHRDLKPSNILVTAAGEVKLLDFGIAKLLVGDATQGVGGAGARGEATELTQRAGSAFTPQYAAPEQLQGGDVTTATDVYALGVLLYLLLSGQHPTAGNKPAAAGIDEAPLERLRALLETEPRRLSDAVRSGSRSSSDAKRARELRGDLDTIVARALKKAPAERYANAAALADDLRRWTLHEPIAARPDSAWYQASKFVRRHRVGVAAGSTAALALAAGLGVALWESREAQAQRAQAEGMIEFMLGDLRKKLEPVGRLDVMDAVGAKALDYYAAQPTGRQDLDSLGRRSRALHLMGEIAEKRGKLDEADRLFREAAASTEELLARAPKDGQRVFDHAQSVYWVGFIARRRGQINEAQAQFKQYLTLAKQLTLLAPENLDWRAEEAYAADNLGVLQLESGDPASALATFSKTRDVWSKLAVGQPAALLELAISWGWISRAHSDLGDYAAGITAEQAKLSALAQLPDAKNSRRGQELKANALHSISRMQFWLGQIERAERSAHEAIAQYQALTDLDPANLNWMAQLSTAQMGLAEILSATDKQVDLQSLLKTLDRDIGRLLAADAGKLEWQLNLRGRLLQLQAQREGASPQHLHDYLRGIQDLAAQGRVFSSDQTRIVASAELLLGDLLSQQPSRHPDAMAHWASAAARLGSSAQRKDMHSMTLLAIAHHRLGKTQEARSLADIVQASSYRDPLYEGLQQALKAPGSVD